MATIRPGTMPGEYDRYNMKRLVSMTATIEGEDLGRVAGQVAEALSAAGERPRGVTVTGTSLPTLAAVAVAGLLVVTSKLLLRGRDA